MKVVEFILIFALIGIIFVSGCVSQESPEGEKDLLDSVADVGIIVHNHWTEDDINDGKKVWVGLVNRRNEYISDEIKDLLVTLTIKGLDETYKNYSIVLFEKTYSDVSLSNIDYPKGEGFIILFSELKEYNQECCVAIFVKVILPNGRVLKTHEPHDFNINPVEF